MILDHIGIAVTNLEEAIKTYEKLLGTACYKRETVASQKVETAFFKTGTSKIELLGAASPDSVIRKFVTKRGEGIHHIAFETRNLEAEITRLKKEGFKLLNEIPKKGADNKRIVFMHPAEAHGVLVELFERIE